MLLHPLLWVEILTYYFYILNLVIAPAEAVEHARLGDLVHRSQAIEYVAQVQQ